jgi:hypothetical protein
MDFGEGFVGARECCIFFVFKIYKNNIFFNFFQVLILKKHIKTIQK